MSLTDHWFLVIFLGFWRLGKVAERVKWIFSWTDLRSLMIFLGFWRSGKVAEWGQVDPVVYLLDVPPVLRVLEAAVGGDSCGGLT